jgi:hypothetical protein
MLYVVEGLFFLAKRNLKSAFSYVNKEIGEVAKQIQIRKIDN